MDTKIIAQKLKESLERIDRELKKVAEEVKILEDAKDYKAMPGVEGTFDGASIVSATGEKIDVPANYAAKSKIVYGDKLKAIDDEGKKVFKQIEKVARKELTGVLSKKDGKWHILTDANTYRISDIAADFQKAVSGGKAVVLVPENNLNVPFATLEKVVVEEVMPAVSVAPAVKPTPAVVKKPLVRAKPSEVKPVVKTAPGVNEPLDKPAIKKRPDLGEDDLN